MLNYLAMEASSRKSVSRASGQPWALGGTYMWSGGLRVTCDVSDNAFEDLRLVRCGAHVSIQVLQLDLLAPKVVPEAVKLACFVLFAILGFKSVAFYSLPHQGGVFIQDTAHGEYTMRLTSKEGLPR